MLFLLAHPTNAREEKKSLLPFNNKINGGKLQQICKRKNLFMKEKKKFSFSRNVTSE
jgi:hypothetical protein